MRDYYRVGLCGYLMIPYNQSGVHILIHQKVIKIVLKSKCSNVFFPNHIVVNKLNGK